MKNHLNFGRQLIVCLCFAAAAASGQNEQWLEYTATKDMRGYRWLELSAVKPANVALPKLEGEAQFVRWTTPLDASGGRWMCLDQPKAGLCTRLHLDLNGNGRLDDDAPVKAARTEEYYAYFDPLRIRFKGEDGPITYHLILRFAKYEGSPPSLLASSGCFYGGNVDFGDGKKRRVELVDANVNGTFNDHLPEFSSPDRITIAKDEPMAERSLGRLVEVEKQFFRIEVARDGAFIKSQKEASVQLGKVTVPESISELVVLGENGHFSRKPTKGECSLPAGKYGLQQWTIRRKDARGDAWELTGYGFQDNDVLTAEAAKPAALDIGEPVRVSMTVSSANKSNISFDLSFKGPMGESVQVMKGSQRPPGPKLVLAGADGKLRSTNTFEFG